MNISLSEEMHSFVLERVRAEHHSSASEYIRSLIRRDLSKLGEAPRPIVLQPPRRANDVFKDFQRALTPLGEEP